MAREIAEIRREIEQIRTRLADLYRSVNIGAEKTRLADLEQQTYADNFWGDQENSMKVNQEISRLRKKLEPWNSLEREIDDAMTLLEIAQEEGDSSVLAEIEEQIGSFAKRFDDLENIELLSGTDDLLNAYLTVHAGAGGTESQDWASMLLRMYMRWAEKQGYSCDLFDYSAGEEAGVKQATILVKGDYAYGFLKGEMGVHRLVRISPFDANKRRHTSFASVEVNPEIDDTINVEINESDLKIDTYRSSGAGGQHVNTTDSAVRITHIPTNTIVACQNERSQHKNKASAMKMLMSKLYELQKRELADRIDEKNGEKKDIAWGSQIRSYVFQPYTMVKDHRTGEETGSVEYVLDGDISPFIYAWLKSNTAKKGAGDE